MLVGELGEQRSGWGIWGNHIFVPRENLMRTPGNGDPGVPIGNPTVTTYIKQVLWLANSKNIMDTLKLIVTYSEKESILFCMKFLQKRKKGKQTT